MELNSVLLSFLFLFSLNSEPVKVAVIDTGSNSIHKLTLCKDGHIDLTKNEPVEYTSKELFEGKWADFRDNSSHGTNISHLIHENAGNSNYCQMIIKYAKGEGDPNSVKNTVKAFKHAHMRGANIVNYSSTGPGALKSEKDIINKMIRDGIIIVTAAGNQGMNLNKKCNTYPACYYKNIIVAGSGFGPDKPANYSNTGKVVDIWIQGSHKKANGVSMSGTSQSTAIATGKLIRMIDKLRNFLND